uniref:Acyl-lipid (7-3)-desaturase n=1 Tax=Rebecca salina TaxID=561169 RepID=D4FAD_REBSA|nr:RecName: Full=Acyl-lipid (7-3)-desaturase; AltName: Full=Acyl-lipid 4-desaturase; AltName: Full=Delta-4 desaturase; Short=PsD4Des [Rebecca salina]AAY15136.1 delta-4 desaturase [Rebecca salina]
MPPSAAKQMGASTGVHAGVTDSSAFTRKDVADRPDLTIVGDSVYDAKAFRSEHPGGAHFVSLFGGRDATEAFMEYHRRAWPKSRMSRFHVGSLASTEEPVAADEGYLQLCARIAKMVPSVSSGFAPASYWVKAGLILGSAIALEAYMLYAGKRLLPSIVLGWLFALIGLNIQHDANHGALSKSASVNLALGLCQDWIGGSMILWLQEHVVMHHLHTNDVDKDPDQKAHGALRLKPTDAWSPMHWLQHLYLLPGETMYAFKLLFLDISELVMWRWEGEPISKLAGYLFMPSLLLKLTFWARFVALPLYLAPSVHTAVCIAATVMTGSFYLAFFFFISHNFEGVASVGPDGSITSMTRGASFLKRQAETSSNVGGPLLATLNGGLNYQIEHHLFPRVHHGFYPRLAPLVKAELEARGIEYKHYPTIWSNLASTLRHMYALGRRPRSKAE